MKSFKLKNQVINAIEVKEENFSKIENLLCHKLDDFKSLAKLSRAWIVITDSDDPDNFITLKVGSYILITELKNRVTNLRRREFNYLFKEIGNQ